MNLFKQILLLIGLLMLQGKILVAGSCLPDPPLSVKQQEALDLLNKLDTSTQSAFWPNINPGDFYRNVKSNILYPEKLYQGHATNFCGYSALSVIFIRTQPVKYTEMILSLYTNGLARHNGFVLFPSLAVRKTAGSLLGKGKLNVHPADQLWLLSLPDHFKGYMNIFDRHYKKGHENKTWAAVTLAKFNRMAKKLGGFETEAWGSDLIRPKRKNNVAFVKEELKKGYVILFVNSKFLHPSKFRIYNVRIPTHFIELHDIGMVDGRVAIKYWDYGLLTVTLMSEARFRKLVYGIVRFNSKQ